MTVLYFTPEAEEQAASIERGWREHARTKPDLFLPPEVQERGLAEFNRIGEDVTEVVDGHVVEAAGEFYRATHPGRRRQCATATMRILPGSTR